ncbi:peptidase M23, partial [Pseudomonas aeruginosa]|nr:peptidase M23 [Pseudomonas aeruginosa]
AEQLSKQAARFSRREALAATRQHRRQALAHPHSHSREGDQKLTARPQDQPELTTALRPREATRARQPREAAAPARLP